MCLIVFAVDQHPQYKLVLAANRDEFFNRPTLEADFWPENNSILSGRDIQSKGTWLGINKNGRFIAITNFRDPQKNNPKAISRGELSYQYLIQDEGVTPFLNILSKQRQFYNGFNLLLSDDGFDTIFHYSNVTNRSTKIESGIHGLSNHLLDTVWPKVRYGKNGISKIIQSKTIKTNDLIELLKNDAVASDNLLPKTGISFDLEKKLSPVFISMNGYGTRCTTAILVDRNNDLTFHEVTYDEKRQPIGEKRYTMKIKP